MKNAKKKNTRKVSKPTPDIIVELPDTPTASSGWVTTSLDDIKMPRDWGDIPDYVLRQFTESAPGRSLESEVELGHVFRLTYTTKSYIATVQVNIGDWKDEMGESIRVESTTWKDQAKYKVHGSAIGNDIAKHANMKLLYDRIMDDLEKFGG